MKKKRITLLSLVLVLCLSTALLAGCGGKPASSGNAAGGTATSAGDAQDNTVVLAIQQNSFITDYKDNYMTKLLEEQLGINIEFYMLPADNDECRTKLSLMATSSEGLPDVIFVDGVLSNEAILQYGQNGFFLPLNEYAEDASLMPNFNSIPAGDREEILQSMAQADGNMYSFPKFKPEYWTLAAHRTYINKAWLDELDLDVPTTTEELKTVLTAFRDQDPNGNGVQDEMGVYGWAPGTYGENVTAVLMNAFTFWNANVQNGGLALADGKVYAPYTTDAWREGLRYMNDLYNEGLLAASIFTDDNTQFKATLNTETPIVGFVSAGSYSNWPNAAENPNFLQLQLMPPLTGPEGVRYSPSISYSPIQTAFVVNGTDKVSQVISLIDAFYDQDMGITSINGIKDVDWTMDPEITSQQTNAYVEAGLSDGIQFVLLNDIWPTQQNTNWHEINPKYVSFDLGNAQYDFSTGKHFDPDDPTQLNAKSYEYYFNEHPEELLPVLKYDISEIDANQDAITTIPDYAKQCLAEFVTGARSIDTGWDTYLAELDSMGLQQWLEAAQAAYGRAQG